MSESIHYSKFRWIALVGAFIVNVCAGMNLLSFAPIMGVIAEDLKIDLGTASFGFMGLGNLAMSVAILIAGFLIDRFGMFPVVICSIVFQTLANFSFLPFGHSYQSALILRILEMVVIAPTFIFCGPMVAVWFPSKEISIANAIGFCGTGIGIMLGLNLVPILTQYTDSWQFGMAGLSVGGFVTLLVIISVSILSKRYQPLTLQSKNLATNDLKIDIKKQILANPMFWIGTVITVTYTWSTQMFNDLSPAYLAVPPPTGIDLGPVISGKLSSIVSFSGIISALFAGFLVDKVFRGNNQIVIMIGMIIGIVFYPTIMISGVYSHIPILIVCLLITGAVTPFVGPTTVSYASKNFAPSVIGRVIGMWMFLGNVGGAAGIMVGSIALRSTGNYNLSIAIAVIFLILGLFTSFFLKNQTTTESIIEVKSFFRKTCK